MLESAEDMRKKGREGRKHRRRNRGINYYQVCEVLELVGNGGGIDALIRKRMDLESSPSFLSKEKGEGIFVVDEDNDQATPDHREKYGKKASHLPYCKEDRCRQGRVTARGISRNHAARKKGQS